MQIGVVTSFFGWLGPTLATAEVAAAAEAAAQVAASYQPTKHEECLAPTTGEHEVGVDIFLAKLFSHIEAQGAIIVVDVALGEVHKDRVCSIDIFELFCGFRIIGILVRVILEG